MPGSWRSLKTFRHHNLMRYDQRSPFLRNQEGRTFCFIDSERVGRLPLTYSGESLQAEDKRMKLIWAVIQPTKLASVEKALVNIGVTRMTVLDAMGYARQRGHIETYRGHEYETNLLRKVQLEIAVNDDFVDKTIACLEDHARSSVEGYIGDGKVFVVPMERAIQISDGQAGPGAI